VYLKRLEIKGFKSFMDKTVLEFGRGVSALVGPNGAGKSNLLDAIIWVLGEQRTSALRTENAAEVIFAGAQEARPAGLAEVTLVVDNSDHALKLPHEEIEITRRLFKTGDSEYWLAGKRARLKDIRDLFLDTGAGKEAYSLVNQQQVDAVLSLRGEDRRRLIEEAAHVSRYRVRRREAYNKLNRTEQNLLRAQDLQAELAERLERLRQPAEEARRYKQLKQQLDEVEQAVLVGQLLARRANLEALSQQLKSRLDELNKLKADLFQLGRRRDELLEAYRRFESEAQESQQAVRAAEAELAKLDTELALVRQQRDFLAQELADSNTGKAAPAERLAALQARIREAERKLEQAQAKSEAKAEEYENLLQAERKALGVLESKRTALQRLQQDHTRLLSAKADLESKVARAQAELEALEQRLGASTEELASLDASLEAARRQEAALKAEVEAAAGKFAAQSETVEKLLSTLEQRRKERDELAGGLNALRRQETELQARLQVLEELDKARQGVSTAARKLLESGLQEASNFKLLLETFQLPPDSPEGLLQLLEKLAHTVVAPSFAALREARRFLSEAKAGSVHFIWRPEQVSPLPEGARPLSDFVKPLPGAEDLLQALPVVPNAEAAQALAASGVYPLVLSETGEVYYSACSTVLGTGAPTTESPVARRAEAARLIERLAALQKQLQDAQAKLAEAEALLGTTEEDFAQARQQATELKAAHRALEEKLAVTVSEVKRLEERKRALEAGRKALEQQLAEGKRRLQQSSEAAKAQAEALAKLDQRRPELQQAVERAEEEYRMAQSQAADGRLALERARLAARQLRQDLQQAESALKRLEDELESERRLRSEKQHKLAQLEQQLAVLEPQRKGLASQLAQQEKRLDEASAQRAEQSKALQSLESLRQRQESLLAEAEAEYHKLELNKLRLENQFEALDQRLWERFEVTFDELDDPEALAQARQATVGEVERLRRELKQLGEVNLGAIRELEEGEALYASRDRQIADLVAARDSLLEMIADLDRTSSLQFQATLGLVAEAFQRRFQEVFGGGKAELVLDDEDNLLESGVSLKVQPPGKRMQSLELLSGGERALVALAFLFALLEVNPAPFCLLDEVDAPLDEVNVKKFLALLEHFKAKTQFIVVTHSPITMKIADALYGVAMEEPGRSKVLSYRMPQRAVAVEKE